MKLSNPSFVLSITLFLSFFMWRFPDFSVLRSGFKQRNELFSIEGLILLFMYIFFIILLYIGFRYKRRNKINLNSYNHLSRNRIYHIFIIISTIGVVITYYNLLTKINFSMIKYWILTGTANNLRYLLYENYKAGLISLRYVIGETFCLMLIRRYIYRKKSYLDIIVLLEMALVIIISNRLILIFSLLSFGIYWNSKKKIKLTLKTLTIIITIIIVLFLLTYSRTKNYYLINYNLGFLGAGISEIKTYLGSPFQGALTTISILINKDNIILEKFYLLSTIQKNLTTNSAIYDLVFNKNIDSIFTLILFLSLFFIIISILMRYLFLYRETVLFFSYSTLMYATAEFWRLFIFFNGIMVVLFLIPIFIYYFNKILK